jgi:hypothetical protein
MADASLALARAHMATQVKDAAAVQAALSRLWDDTIDPADLTRSFARFREAAVPYVNAGRVKGERTADAYINTVLRHAGKPAVTVPQTANTRLADGAIKASLSASTAKSLARAEYIAKRGGDPAIALATAKSNMLGSSKRQIINASRKRVTSSRAVERWARVSDGKPCAFCAMLVSRGPVYTDAGVDFNAHDRCGCNARLVLPGDADGGWSPEARVFRKAWDSTKDGTSGETFAEALRKLYESPLTDPAIPAVPAWLRTVQEAAKALPEDRATIGVKTATLTNEADRFIVSLKEAEAQLRIGDRTSIVSRRMIYEDGLRQNDGWIESLDGAVEWDDVPPAIVAELRREGHIVFNTWTPEMVRASLVVRSDAIRKMVDEHNAHIAKIDNLAKELRDTRPELFARRADDLDDRGELGSDTQKALDGVLAAGKALDEELTRRIRPIEARIAALDDEVADARRTVEATATAMIENYSEAAEELYEAAERRLRELRDTVPDKRLALYKEKRAETRKLLDEVRPMGGGKRPKYDKTRGQLVDAVNEAFRNYPTAWNDTVAELFPDVELKKVKRGYNQGGKVIALSEDTGTWARTGPMGRIATHELGHSMEKVPGVRGLEWAYHYSRSDKVTNANGKTELAPVFDIYGANIGMGSELAHPDKWADNYIGKTYRQRGGVGADSSWEVFTMGAESLFDSSPWYERKGDLGDDADFRAFILGTLALV